MPELPEVEAARRAVEEHCVGKKIIRAIIADDSKVIDRVSPKDFEASLVGKTIVAAHRKGKNMWLRLDSPPFPSFQFGMAGAVYMKGVVITKYKRAAVKDTDEWPSKYSKFFVELDDGLEFSFTDKRRFAKVRLLQNPSSVPPISELGPDALSEPMTTDEFYSSLRKKNTGIKALLLDQSFISGIGNWMADEVLYQARIHPQQIASSMSKESCNTLLESINEVIEKAVEVGADSSQFPSNWIFHQRDKKPGKAIIDGKTIEFINAGGRTTAYIPELQKLIGEQSIKAASKRSKKKDTDNENGDDLDELEVDVGQNNKKEKSKPSAKRKMTSAKGKDESDNDSYNPQETEEGKGPRKRTTRNKALAVRKKSKEIDSERDDLSGDDGNDDDDDDDGGQEAVNAKQKKKGMAKTSKNRAQNSENMKQPKKKAK